MKSLVTILALLCALHLAAQPRAPYAVAYYDVDRLYDTLPSPFYNDDDYTPQGLYRWDTERYRRKIENTAAVIDSLALPVVGLWGVENEAVVRDLSAACHGDYSYIHRTLNTFDGRDFALMYFGDRFFPEFVTEGRRYLYIEGTMDGQTVGILLVAEPRMARLIVEELREERPEAQLIVMGRCNGVKPSRHGVADCHRHAERAGRGTVCSRSGWVMRDRILLDTAFRATAADVYAREFLFDRIAGTPMRTVDRQSYHGGYSYSLPVYVCFCKATATP